MKKRIIFIFFLWLSISLPASQFDLQGSARYISMGSSGLAMQDSADSVFHNPAGLVFDRSSSFDLIYTFNNTYGISGYFINSGAVLLPVKYNIHAGIGIVNESIKDIVTANNVMVSAGYAIMDNISAGVSLHYYLASFSSADFEDMKISYAEIGVIYKIQALRLALLFNSNEFQSETIYNNIKCGVSYKYDRFNLIINADVKVQPDIHYADGYRFIVNAGLEKMIIHNLYFRMGVDKLNIALGLGIQYKKFSFDYAYSSALSGNQLLSVQYHF